MRESLKTIRLSKELAGFVDQFLQKNPAIENFSALVRIAVLDLISRGGSIPLRPIVREEAQERPSFLWDYDLTEGQIREIIAGPLEKRRWLVARILERAQLKEVWRYLTLDQIERDLPHLRLPAKTKEHWAHAIKIWKGAA